MLLMGFDNFARIIFFINIVLVSDGDKGRSTDMNGKIEIAANGGVFSCDDVKIVFFGEVLNMATRCSGGNDYLRMIILI